MLHGGARADVFVKLSISHHLPCPPAAPAAPTAPSCCTLLAQLSPPHPLPYPPRSTGGIRCDVYGVHLRQKGFNKLYTLEGGIQV